MNSLTKCGSPLPLLKEVVRRGGILRLGDGLFEVSEQHGRHDGLLCVDGEQGRGGLLRLQRHQDQSSAVDRPPGKPAGENENMGQPHETTERDTEL